MTTSRQSYDGFVVSAPVEYDAKDFLLYLYATLLEFLTGRTSDEALSIYRAAEQRIVPRRNRIDTLASTSIAGGTLGIFAVIAVVVGMEWSRLSGGVSVASLVGAAMIFGGTLSGLIVSTTFTYRRSLVRPALVVPAAALITGSGLGLVVFFGGLGNLTVYAALLYVLVIVWLSTLARLRRTLLDRASHERDLRQSRYHSAPGFDDASSRYADQRLLRKQATIRLQESGSLERSLVGSAGIEQFSLEASRKNTSEYSLNPFTYPELIAEIRFSLADAARRRGRLVVGIDELDKVGNVTAAYDFLNDIKAIFGIPQVFFIVSVSDDAAATFQRRGAPFRDAFDSAFDDVVELTHLDADSSEELLSGLFVGWTRPFLDFCTMWSGSRPRDLVRVANACVRLCDSAGTVEIHDAATTLICADVRAQIGGTIRALGQSEQKSLQAKSLDLILRRWLDIEEVSRDWLLRGYKEMRENFALAPDVAEDVRALATVVEATSLLAICVYDYFALDFSDRLGADLLSRAMRARPVSPEWCTDLCVQFRGLNGLVDLVS